MPTGTSGEVTSFINGIAGMQRTSDERMAHRAMALRTWTLLGVDVEGCGSRRKFR